MTQPPAPQPIDWSVPRHAAVLESVQRAYPAIRPKLQRKMASRLVRGLPARCAKTRRRGPKVPDALPDGTEYWWPSWALKGR